MARTRIKTTTKPFRTSTSTTTYKPPVRRNLMKKRSTIIKGGYAAHKLAAGRPSALAKPRASATGVHGNSLRPKVKRIANKVTPNVPVRGKAKMPKTAARRASSLPAPRAAKPMRQGSVKVSQKKMGTGAGVVRYTRLGVGSVKGQKTAKAVAVKKPIRRVKASSAKKTVRLKRFTRAVTPKEAKYYDKQAPHLKKKLVAYYNKKKTAKRKTAKRKK